MQCSAASDFIVILQTILVMTESNTLILSYMLTLLLNFYFHTFLQCLKRLYEGLKGLFETLHRSVEIKNLN